MHLLLIALGGAAGALCRHAVNQGVKPWSDDFPLGTLLVNVVGCFLLGVLAELTAEHTHAFSAAARHALAVGFLGALTTFSTFGLETMRDLERGRPHVALLNVAANLALGLAAVWLALALTRYFTK